MDGNYNRHRQKKYQGTRFGFHIVVAVTLNVLTVLTFMDSMAMYILGSACVSLLYYQYYGDEMNYFIVTDEKFIVRNQWRIKFQREFRLDDVASAGWFKVLHSGPYLAITTKDGRHYGFDGANVGFQKMMDLTDHLNAKIGQ